MQLEAKSSNNILLEQVHDFWNSHPCGAQKVIAQFGTPEFFRLYARYRYRSEWHLNHFVPFDQYRDKHVLEIGCGLGTDGIRFAENGALYTGVDLTEAAVEAARLQFKILGLTGSFLVQNAEQMDDLPTSKFDLVYSHGVLHHSPRIESALIEIKRVLKPGGKIILMLYHRHSFNYYIRILAYMRLKVLFYILIHHLLPEKLRTGDLELHYRNFSYMGMRYLSVTEFPHHATDGPECPIANSYTMEDIQKLFTPFFASLRFAIAHFPIHNSIPIFPLCLEKFLASRWGWYLFIYGSKV